LGVPSTETKRRGGGSRFRKREGGLITNRDKSVQWEEPKRVIGSGVRGNK